MEVITLSASLADGMCKKKQQMSMDEYLARNHRHQFQEGIILVAKAHQHQS